MYKGLELEEMIQRRVPEAAEGLKQTTDRIRQEGAKGKASGGKLEPKSRKR